MDSYEPPTVWTWDPGNGGQFANINRPTAGATQDVELSRGKHALQLYSLATPNGVKVTVMLEELLELGHTDAEYDAWLINIGTGDQFGSGFVGVNPNSKIPALLDHSTDPPTRVFESGSILLYLAERFGEFLPTEPRARTEALSWLFWQMGAGPYLVVPILGPSSIRDAGGLLVDRAALSYLLNLAFGNVASDYPVLYLLQALQYRDDVAFRYGQLGSAFEYEWIRWFYLEFRRLSVDI